MRKKIYGRQVDQNRARVNIVNQLRCGQTRKQSAHKCAKMLIFSQPLNWTYCHKSVVRTVFVVVFRTLAQHECTRAIHLNKYGRFLNCGLIG